MTVLAGLEPIPCPCYECRLTRAADDAIARNGVADVEGTDLMVVADVIIAEAIANGDDVPDTHKAIRADGRAAYLFRQPAPKRLTLGDVDRRRRAS